MKKPKANEDFDMERGPIDPLESRQWLCLSLIDFAKFLGANRAHVSVWEENKIYYSTNGNETCVPQTYFRIYRRLRLLQKMCERQSRQAIRKALRLYGPLAAWEAMLTAHPSVSTKFSTESFHSAVDTPLSENAHSAASPQVPSVPTRPRKPASRVREGSSRSLRPR